MKTSPELIAFLLAPVIAIALATVVSAQRQNQSPSPQPAVTTARTLPLEFGKKLPLAIQSSGVEWKGYTYHLLGLHTIEFKLDEATSHLQAEIKAATTSFDSVDYDISVAVLDADGALLGSARAKCEVLRVWLGKVAMSPQTVPLDFGVSLDYPRAARFMITISHRKILTPDAWQPAKK